MSRRVNHRPAERYPAGMRPLSLWRHEARRAGLGALLAPLVAAVGLAAVAVDGAVRLDQPSQSTALVLQSLLELALPLAAGMAGFGLLAGALSGSPAVASAVVASLWLFEYAAADLLQEHRWSRLLYLFATTRGTVDQDWTANRLTLLAAGVAMTAAGWLLLRRPSRLLTKEAE